MRTSAETDDAILNLFSCGVRISDVFKRGNVWTIGCLSVYPGTNWSSLHFKRKVGVGDSANRSNLHLYPSGLCVYQCEYHSCIAAL